MSKGTHFIGQPMFGQLIFLLDKSKILKFSREKDGECSGNGAVYAGGLVGFNEGGIVCTCCTDSSDASIGGGTEGHTTQISVEGCTHN